MDPKPQEEPNAIWKVWKDQQAALSSGCFPLALQDGGCGLWFCGFPTFKEASFQKRVKCMNPFLLSHGSGSILQAKWFHGALSSLLLCCLLLMLQYVHVYVLSNLSLELRRVSAWSYLWKTGFLVGTDCRTHVSVHKIVGKGIRF